MNQLLFSHLGLYLIMGSVVLYELVEWCYYAGWLLLVVEEDVSRLLMVGFLCRGVDEALTDE